jgi:hypothetical protein
LGAVLTGQPGDHRIARQAQRHAEIGEVGERVAEGGQLPVDHREHARAVGREDEVVDAEIAVHQRHLAVVGRAAPLEPGTERVHGGDIVGGAVAVLLAPARELAREVVAGLAVVGQAHGARVERMDGGEHAHDLLVPRAPLGGIELGQRRIPMDATVDVAHEIEHRPDHAVVAAQVDRLRHRDAAAVQRLEHAELAVDRVRRGQELAGRFPPQHVTAGRGFDQVGRIGLPALELLGAQRCAETRHLRLEVEAELGLGQGVGAHAADSSGAAGRRSARARHARTFPYAIGGRHEPHDHVRRLHPPGRDPGDLYL